MDEKQILLEKQKQDNARLLEIRNEIISLKQKLKPLEEESELLGKSINDTNKKINRL